MKVLYLNAMCATAHTPAGGIFVTRRIEAAKQNGVDAVPVNLYVEDVGILKWAKKNIFHMPLQIAPLSQQASIIYTNIGVAYSAFDAVCWSLFGRLGQRLLLKKFKKKGLTNIECDLIHVHWFWPYAGEVAYWMSGAKGVPYYITCHGSEINYAMRNPKFNARMIFLLEQAEKVEFVSQRLLETAVRLGYSGTNARVINNGYDARIFKLIEKKENDYKIVGFVGNLIPVKGCDRLVKIIPEILKKVPDAEFIIIGDGKLRTSLEKELSDLPVKFLGQLEPQQVSSYMNMMDILLVPSRNEGFPCAVKEAQACGTVVVGSDVGGIKEAIGNGGITVSNNISEDDFIHEFADSAARILRGELIIDRVGMLEDVKQYSWQELQKKTLEMYRGEQK